MMVQIPTLFRLQTEGPKVENLKGNTSGIDGGMTL